MISEMTQYASVNDCFNLRENIIIALVELRRPTVSYKVVCYIKGADDIVLHH